MKYFLTLHGANPENLYNYFGIEIPERVLDFSTNTNIFPCPDFDIDIKNLISRYPDNECKKLLRLISEREHISPEKILFTNGINEAVFLLAGLLKEKRTGIFQPCYTEYSRAFPDAENVFNIKIGGTKNSIIEFYMSGESKIDKISRNIINQIKKYSTDGIISKAESVKLVRFINDLLDSCRKNRILVRLTKVLQIPVVA